MIKGLVVTNHNGESLELDLFHPEWSGIIITNITGLGPPTATINFNELALVDGGIFTSSKIGTRNIVLSLRMMWDPLIEDSRLRIYKYFPIKKPISLEVITDRRHAVCHGYVESNPPDIFSSEESTQVSILCPDPFFYEMEQSIEIFSGVQPLFEFPFSNESLTENLIEFSVIHEDSRGVINYKGDADTGVLITCHVMFETVENLTLWNTDTREHMRIDTNKIKQLTGIQYSQGDDIIINTKTGEKSVRFVHEGKTYNIISCIEKDADWFKLTAGLNTFTFVADHGESNVMMTVSYHNAYAGM